MQISTVRVIEMTIIIIAVLGVIFFLYSVLSTQSRDALRKSEINALALALESNYDGGYEKLIGANFKDNKVPSDPYDGEYKCNGIICRYCIRDTSSFCEARDLPITEKTAFNMESFHVCANLENGQYFCLENRR